MSLQLASNLIYSQPEIQVSGSSNFVSYKPVSGSSFNSGESFDIVVSSPNEFLDARKSYIKYNVKMSGGATSAGNLITSQGLATVFSSITTSVSGVELERIDRYPVFLSQIYKNSPVAYKDTLASLESYGVQTSLHASANAYTTGRTCCHSIRCGALESPQSQLLPLAFLRGGLKFTIQLGTLNDLLAATNNQADTNFTVSDVEFVGCMVKPSDEYLSSFASSLAGGKTAKYPIELTRNVRVVPRATTVQSHTINMGYAKSLRSVLAVQRLNTSINAAAVDAYANDTLNTLKQYTLEIGSERYPRNKQIQCTNTQGSTIPIDPEIVMQKLISVDNNFTGIAAPTHAATNTGNAIFYNWSNTWGSGVPVADGQFTLNLEYQTAPSADASVMDIFISYDGVLEIGASNISVNTRDF